MNITLHGGKAYTATPCFIQYTAALHEQYRDACKLALPYELLLATAINYLFEARGRSTRAHSMYECLYPRQAITFSFTLWSSMIQEIF
jgi:hypothetical protein